MSRSERRLLSCFVVACSVHAAASLALSHLHPGMPQVDGVATERLAEVSIEDAPPPSLEPPGPTRQEKDTDALGTRTASAPSRDARPRVPSASATSPLPGSETGSAREGLGLGSGLAGARDPDGWTFRATRGAADLFAGATTSLAQPFDVPPRASPSRAPTASRSGGLAEGLDAADHARGLGRGGPVLAAVEDAARSGEAPQEGVAEYEVVVRRAGPVDVFLVSANDEKWAQIGPAIRESVSARHVLIPGGTSGMRFVVRVEASMRFPDGKRRADLGNKTIATTGWGGKDEPGLSSPGVPMVGVVHTGKVCSVGAALAPGMVVVGGACSVENLGSDAVRVVHGRVVSESRID